MPPLAMVMAVSRGDRSVEGVRTLGLSGGDADALMEWVREGDIRSRSKAESSGC